ncbi:dTMP kinase [Roseiflexus sp. RS-1]|uniref:Thymidylate kinase n=1 Tax=Roseiflexus sp. (strain RS-1) TaxID=357808 RepID=KTHY_ROSS1|nr:dTMP kinase [Roseiflexus sp. RS-1]A5UY90.1 RecName: Full=Thymidylate kinase; AltName: Full=dTMP kinase [Roseiflexus sp. RS-1]ABQ91593.1 thymidylate kinase [Roseiflexus sp. RS-1]
MSLFVTFEGPEGSGKSTQARLLYESLHARRFPVILTREPGGTRIGDLIRRIVLDLQHTEMAPTAEMLLFSAARAQLVSEVIRPYLEQGGIVLCDRYADSTFAYQGYGLGRDLAELRVITAAATGGLRPDITFYLDISAAEGLERKRRKGARSTGQRGANNDEWNRLDARELEYHQRVEAGYRELIAADPERWRVLDARQSIEALAEQIGAIVEPYLASITRLETVL